MTRRTALLVPALLAVLVLFSVPVFADKLHLKNGSTFEGKLIRETATHYIFKVRGMGEQRFKKSEVLKVEKGESAFDVYEKRRKAVAKDDAKGWYELGMWCKDQGLRKEARACFRNTLKADDDHAGARQELGYVRYHGEWMTEKDYKKVAAETEAKEAEIVSGLKLAKDPVQDAALRYLIVGPADWKAEKKDGEGVDFTGPELGGVAVEIDLEVDEGDGELDELIKTQVKKLGEENDGVLQKGEPKECTLCGKPAKLVVTGWTADDIQPWKVDVERRDIFMVAPHGVYHLTVLCAAGYYERLSGTIEKVIASVKILDKPLDLMAEEHGFGLAFPDDTYEKSDGSMPVHIDFNGTEMKLNGVVASVKLKTGWTSLLVRVTKKAEGATLESIKNGIPNTFSIPQIIQMSGEAKSRKVDGVDALTGELGILQGMMGRDLWCVFVKGDRVYECHFVTMVEQMGRRYMQKDFGKFLDGWKFL